jgi:hypothetical protein
MVEVDSPRHWLAARNLVVGDTDFLALSLPQPWRVTKALVTPEVRTTTRVGARLWVASGETRHVVFDRARNVGLELVVHISSGTQRFPRARQVLDDGRAVCSGHEGAYRIVRRGRGFLMRGEELALFVVFLCPPTSRGLRIEIAGDCTIGELHTFLRALADLECH